MCSAAFGVISLAVDRSSKGSSVITGSLRWRQRRGPLKGGTEAKKRKNVGECKVSSGGEVELEIQQFRCEKKDIFGAACAKPQDMPRAACPHRIISAWKSTNNTLWKTWLE